ncbi:hypothetical protein RhiirA5_366897 [Rhizophagus irregularis]|uniref:Uncharacterized protein n=3 Tax=Rhizophagus irregularis TaxID=588596 RepID=A0A2N1N4C1_9GLOM|nr:hypothetical protein RirG_048720 [Rhizophagus irregularis DAOM 197198w]PKB98606.1 hypothetical protein RhiirA5_366897 [Rhizophagus irregularis]PKK68709.1 hypothetical protein RhiirC2_749709 [Rhizophagus irregularis]CAG8570654.1 8936_t:CDS:2 [Rhizophagus irregularis]
MDNENKEALSPITKEIEEKAVKIKEGLKHVETKENNKLPTAAEIEAEKKEKESEEKK